MKRIIAIAFAAVFLLLCAVLMAGLLITGGAQAGANEVLAQSSLTDASGAFNTEYLEDAADYINDRFFLRQEAVSAWAWLNAKLLRSSVTDSVVLGREGWLFYEPTLPDYTRADPMTERELFAAARTLFLLQEYVEGQGGAFLFTLAPNKNSLYGEYMYPRARADMPSNAERLRELLSEQGVNYLDLFAALSDWENPPYYATVYKAPLYFATDSHWNERGAALAADAVLAALGRESGYFYGPWSGTAEHRGDLYEMLYPAGRRREADSVYGPGFTFTASSQNPDSITITTRSETGTGRLLMYRDSFGRNLYPYLAESFQDAVFSRKNRYDPAPLEAGDVMAVELVERNIAYLNQYLPVFPAPARPAALAEGAALYRHQLSLTLAKDAPVGYTVLSGVFDPETGGLPDARSPVYVDTPLGLFEAVPGADSFSVCLPEEAAAGAARGELRIVFYREGALVSLDSDVREG